MVVDGTVGDDDCNPAFGGAENEGVKDFAPGLKETFVSFSGSANDAVVDGGTNRAVGAVPLLLNVTHDNLEKTT